MTTNTVRQLYRAFLYSKMKYGLEVYSNTSSRNIHKLRVMQNKLLKYVMRPDLRTGTNPVQTTIAIMKVEDLHNNNVLTFVNMCLMGQCLEIFNQHHRVKCHTLRNKTGRESSYAIPQKRIRRSISESSRSQTLEPTGKRPGIIQIHTLLWMKN